jgi:hypothetical protein
MKHNIIQNGNNNNNQPMYSHSTQYRLSLQVALLSAKTSKVKISESMVLYEFFSSAFIFTDPARFITNQTNTVNQIMLNKLEDIPKEYGRDQQFNFLYGSNMIR